MISMQRRSDGAPAYADTEAQARMLQVQGYNRLEGHADVASVDESPADSSTDDGSADAPANDAPAATVPPPVRWWETPAAPADEGDAHDEDGGA